MNKELQAHAVPRVCSNTACTAHQVLLHVQIQYVCVQYMCVFVAADLHALLHACSHILTHMQVHTHTHTHTLAHTHTDLKQAASHGVRGLITLPLTPLLAFPDVTCLAPVVQAISAHAVACEITGRLLLTT